MWPLRIAAPLGTQREALIREALISFNELERVRYFKPGANSDKYGIAFSLY